MRLTRSSVFVLLLSLCTILGSAATITVTDVDGFWQNPIPGVTIVNGDPLSTARWGTPATTGGSQSGYNFLAQIPPSQAVVVPPTSNWIKLGDFTHVNFPITGTSLTQIDLRLDVDLNVDGGPTITETFVYTLFHNETPNSAGNCPVGSVSVCDDVVTISAPSAGSFIVGGVLYTLELVFDYPDGAPFMPTTQILTQESANNLAGIYGRFTAEGVPNVEVPEPSTLGLLGLGLLVLAGITRRKKNA